MPATGRDISRRTALLALCAVRAVAADSAQEVWDVVTTLAAALGRSDAGEFLSVCDPKMPAYDRLRVSIVALVAQADAESGIDPVRNSGDDRTRDVEADWQLHLVDRSALQRVITRREIVTVKLEKQGRKWKVVAIEPLVFFAPLPA
jgi:hypothetical protein